MGEARSICKMRGGWLDRPACSSFPRQQLFKYYHRQNLKHRCGLEQLLDLIFPFDFKYLNLAEKVVLESLPHTRGVSVDRLI